MVSKTHPRSRYGQRRSRRMRAAATLRLSGVLALMLRVPSWRGVVALSYHRIGDPERSSLYRGGFSATQELFDSQLRTLKRHFELVTVAELRDAATAVRGRRVMVTFDDGYRDLYEMAYPVLQSNGVRATMFLCSGFIDGVASAWWDEIAWMLHRASMPELPPGRWSPDPLSLAEDSVEQAIGTATRAYWKLSPTDTEQFLTALGSVTGSGRRPREASRGDWITWEMARTMKAAGHHLGGHTVTHPILSALAAERQAEEINQSLDRIEAETGEHRRVFAYPVGHRETFTAETEQLAHAARVEVAFSNYGGYVTPASFRALDFRRFSSEMLRDRDLFRATVALPQLFARVDLGTNTASGARSSSIGRKSGSARTWR